MRLFLAINLPEKTKCVLESAVTQLQRQGIRASWSRRENYHLTLLFLGEVADPTPVIAAMKRVQGESFSLCFTQCGRFRGRGGDIFWLGVDPSEPLLNLYSALYQELLKAGFALERRAYRPHLTLARRLRHRGEISFPGSLPAPVRVQNIALMRSELRSEGPCYTELFRKELRG